MTKSIKIDFTDEELLDLDVKCAESGLSLPTLIKESLYKTIDDFGLSMKYLCKKAWEEINFDQTFDFSNFYFFKFKKDKSSRIKEKFIKFIQNNENYGIKYNKEIDKFYFTKIDYKSIEIPDVIYEIAKYGNILQRARVAMHHCAMDQLLYDNDDIVKKIANSVLSNDYDKANKLLNDLLKYPEKYCI